MTAIEKGARVRVKNGVRFDAIVPGATGVVEYSDHHPTLNIRVRFDNGDPSNWLSEDELEVLS